jgi:hypothetical protein
MNDQLKIYGFSIAAFTQYLLELLNPLMSFVLVLVTILYTYQKYKTEKNKNKKNEN